MTLTQSHSILTDDLLDSCAQRAADYDRKNRFFFEDFEQLRDGKYLLSAVPKEFGGLGLTLVQICQEQRRLAAGAALGADSPRHQHAPHGDRYRRRSMAQRRHIQSLDLGGGS
jgi:alkylation response protein AidB-like acyl-CoA dehydrogenase